MLPVQTHKLAMDDIGIHYIGLKITYILVLYPNRHLMDVHKVLTLAHMCDLGPDE